MNALKWIFGTLFMGGLAAIGVGIYNEVQTAKSLVVTFNYIRGFTLYYQDEPNLPALPLYSIDANKQPMLGFKLALDFLTAGYTELTVERVEINFLYGALNIGRILKESSTKVTRQNSVQVFDGALRLRPLLNLIFDFFKTSKIPITVIGKIEYSSSTFGATIPVPLKFEIDLKKEIYKYSPEYIQVLLKMFNKNVQF